MSEETKKTTRTISRREFLRDAGIVVGGTAVSSAFFLSACGKEVEVTKTVTDKVVKYICPVDSLEFDSLEALKAHYDSAHESAGVTAENVTNLIVNGERYEVQVKSNETLQDVLRQKLGFTSPKDMCFGQGACGSCTVIMDERPILSCMSLAIECNGAKIETAEGLADINHPLIDAAVKNHAMQCGYCTPGFLITAKALLDHNPNPTETDIREALASNICFCGTYPAHAKTIIEAAKNL